MHVVDVGEGEKAKGGGRDLQSRHQIDSVDKLEADGGGGGSYAD